VLPGDCEEAQYYHHETNWVRQIILKQMSGERQSASWSGIVQRKPAKAGPKEGNACIWTHSSSDLPFNPGEVGSMPSNNCTRQGMASYLTTHCPSQHFYIWE
jgi:hypothetical protein